MTSLSVTLLAYMLCSCRTVVPCVAETVVRDSVRVQRVLDSVYLYERDSIFVESRRDTVWVERWRTRYKYAVRVERDTVRDVRTEVLKDGRVFVYGVGGYDGINPFESGNILSVISALGERIDALNEHVTAIEARIAALEGA
ncbi:MAG: hypothetical protein SOT07_00690 [Paludibacteraceae bacterium]|nr:hypothetical protein [Paludibacteraceae bacterium]